MLKNDHKDRITPHDSNRIATVLQKKARKYN